MLRTVLWLLSNGDDRDSSDRAGSKGVSSSLIGSTRVPELLALLNFRSTTVGGLSVLSELSLLELACDSKLSSSGDWTSSSTSSNAELLVSESTRELLRVLGAFGSIGVMIFGVLISTSSS